MERLLVNEVEIGLNIFKIISNVGTFVLKSSLDFVEVLDSIHSCKTVDDLINLGAKKQPE